MEEYKRITDIYHIYNIVCDKHDLLDVDDSQYFLSFKERYNEKHSKQIQIIGKDKKSNIKLKISDNEVESMIKFI